MSTTQQLFNWPADGMVEQCGDSAVSDQRLADDNNDRARKCSTCRAVIGVHAVTCEECWHYCMGDTAP